MTKKVITFALLLAIIALPFVQVNAAGKTVAGDEQRVLVDCITGSLSKA